MDAALAQPETPPPSAPDARLAPAPQPSRPRLSLNRLRRRALYELLWPLWKVWHKLLNPSYPRPGPGVDAALRKRFLALLDRDLENVRRGVYPASLLTQFSTFSYGRAWLDGWAEIPTIALRRRGNGWNQLPAGVDLQRYPPYYRRTFHWQTDGWFSERSARLYDLSVGFLFRGTTDAMRRMALPPLVEAVKGLPAPRILDVASGSGRFLAQLHAALPRARLTGLDLSPAYLAFMRRRLAGLPGLELVEGNAESMPLPDAAFDAVVSVYLFHEVPRTVRRTVFAEMKRVLKPGGTLVLCDSLQRAEAGPLEYYLDWFPAMYHEPFYTDYSNDDLAEALKSSGFEVLSSEPHYLSKVVVARAPGASAGPGSTTEA